MKEKCKIIYKWIICVAGFGILLRSSKYYIIGAFICAGALVGLITTHIEMFERKVELIKYNNPDWQPPEKRKYEHPNDYANWILLKLVLFGVCSVFVLAAALIVDLS